MNSALRCPECEGGEVEHYRMRRTCAPVGSPRSVRVPCPACGGDGRRACEECTEQPAEHLTALGALCADCADALPVEAAYGPPWAEDPSEPASTWRERR